MIYIIPSPTDPIRQGDIFLPLPRPLNRLAAIQIHGKKGIEASTWMDCEKPTEGIQITCTVVPCWAIVSSQDCDCARGGDSITFLQITNNPLKEEANAEKRVKTIVRADRLNEKGLYLPPDGTHFKSRMQVDFGSSFQINREDISNALGSLRVLRLNEIALQHYREKLAQYYRRYAYDEWYALNKEEFNIYNEYQGGEIPPFPWQK